MLKMWNSKIFQLIFGAFLSLILFFLTQRFLAGKEYAKTVKDEFDKRPTTEQINIKFEEVKKYIDIQDRNTLDQLNLHIDESNKTSAATMDYLKSLDGNVKILLQRTK